MNTEGPEGGWSSQKVIKFIISLLILAVSLRQKIIKDLLFSFILPGGIIQFYSVVVLTCQIMQLHPNYVSYSFTGYKQ